MLILRIVKDGATTMPYSTEVRFGFPIPVSITPQLPYVAILWRQIGWALSPFETSTISQSDNTLQFNSHDPSDRNLGISITDQPTQGFNGPVYRSGRRNRLPTPTLQDPNKPISLIFFPFSRAEDALSQQLENAFRNQGSFLSVTVPQLTIANGTVDLQIRFDADLSFMSPGLGSVVIPSVISGTYSLSCRFLPSFDMNDVSRVVDIVLVSDQLDLLGFAATIRSIVQPVIRGLVIDLGQNEINKQIISTAASIFSSPTLPAEYTVSMPDIQLNNGQISVVGCLGHLDLT
jgi:hypothetical protein